MPVTRSFDEVTSVLLSSITAVPARFSELLIVSTPTAPLPPGARLPPFRTVTGPPSSPAPASVAPFCTETLPVFNQPSTCKVPAAIVVVPE